MHNKRMYAPVKKLSMRPIFVIVFLGMLCTTIFFYIKYQEAQSVLSSTTLNQDQELTEVINKVSRHFSLPQGEIPTLATVSEVEKLRAQAFFHKAENGDKVLIYADTRKAILYRPRIDKIIEVAPITVNDEVSNVQSQPVPQQSPNSTPTASSTDTEQAQSLRIELRNGTTNNELSNIVRSNITSQNNNVEIIAATNAVNINHTRTTIVALNSEKQTDIQKIALQLNAEYRTELLEGEPESTADAVIIIGSDYSEG